MKRALFAALLALFLICDAGNVSAGWRELFGWHSRCQTCAQPYAVCPCPECCRQEKEKHHCCLWPPAPPRAGIGIAIPFSLNAQLPEDFLNDEANEQAAKEEADDLLQLKKDLAELTLIVEELVKQQKPMDTSAVTPKGPAEDAPLKPLPQLSEVLPPPPTGSSAYALPPMPR